MLVLIGFPFLTSSSYPTGVPRVTSPTHPQPLPLLLRTAVTLCCRQGILNPFTGFYGFKQVTALLRHNSHTPKFTLLKVYNSVVLSMFTECNHHHRRLFLARRYESLWTCCLRASHAGGAVALAFVTGFLDAAQ